MEGGEKIESENKNQQTGEELFNRFLNGDNAAFEEFVKMYEEELSKFVYNCVQDYYDTKHIVIDTFSQMIVSGRKYSGKSSIKTYLFAIGKNISASYIRARRKNQYISYDEIMELAGSEEISPETRMEREETKQELHKAMRRLKGDYHAALLLVYFEDMSYIQAGQAMKKTETQIRGLAHRAKRALKRVLESKGYE